MNPTGTLPLPESALAFLAVAQPTREDLSALAGLSAGAMSTLVTALEERRLADHLQLVSELGSAGGPSRREAKQALFRLAGRGVTPTAARRLATVPPTGRPREAVNLDALCLASPPGLFGRYWLLLGSVPGAEALELKGSHSGEVEAVEVLRSVSPSRVKNLAAEFARHAVRGRPVPVRAGTALRLLALWGRSQDRQQHPRWRAVEAWIAAAREAGASDHGCSARESLGHLPDGLPTRELLRLREGGIHLPAPDILRAVLDRFQTLVDAPPENPDDVDVLALRFGTDALARWLDVPRQREKLVCALEATADVLYDARRHEAARGFLGLADTTRDALDGTSLAQTIFFSEVLKALFDGDYADAVGAATGVRR
jgi:hypothetical protein